MQDVYDRGNGTPHLEKERNKKGTTESKKRENKKAVMAIY
jgi:hypothetical protein